jgi:hypothetical protein
MKSDMTDTDPSSTDPAGRRRHRRVPGPFDGRRIEMLMTVPLRIYDLSMGGCLIEAHHRQRPGQRFTLEIDVPLEGWIQCEAESLYVREEYGFAARFVEMSDEARQRLERGLGRLGAPAATS